MLKLIGKKTNEEINPIYQELIKCKFPLSKGIDLSRQVKKKGEVKSESFSSEEVQISAKNQARKNQSTKVEKDSELLFIHGLLAKNINNRAKHVKMLGSLHENRE